MDIPMSLLYKRGLVRRSVSSRLTAGASAGADKGCDVDVDAGSHFELEAAAATTTPSDIGLTKLAC